MGGSPLRIGVVGTGYWAEEVHAAGVAACPDSELAGVWGRDAGKATRVAQVHGTTAFADFDDLLDSVDALTFAVPPQVQADLALRAARAGKHLLLEKPVATDPAASEALVAAVDERDLATVVFFTERFVPANEAWLTAQAAVAPLGGRACWLASLDTPDNPFAGSPWRGRDGALWDVGPHALSVMLPILGPVTAIAGARGHRDQVTLLLTHESGATSTVELSLTMPPDATRFAVETFTDSGWQTRQGADFDVRQAHALAVSDLADLVRTGRRDHRCDVRFGHEVVRLLAAAEQIVGRREGA